MPTQLALFPYLEHQAAQRPQGFIPIYQPARGADEERHMLAALRSGWISSLGQYITRFEQADEAYPLTRDRLILALRERGIDSRPFFYPLYTLPPYYCATPCLVALRLSQQGINLPSTPSLTDEQVAYIYATLHHLAA